VRKEAGNSERIKKTVITVMKAGGGKKKEESKREGKKLVPRSEAHQKGTRRRTARLQFG